jgi:RecA-family ATPase
MVERSFNKFRAQHEKSQREFLEALGIGATSAPGSSGTEPKVPKVENQQHTDPIIEAPSTRIAGSSANASTLTIHQGDELLSRPAPPRRWRVPQWMPQAETTLMAGDGGSGKTTLALQLAMACIGGGKWLGLGVEPCNVLYISAEDPTDESHYRLEQINKQLRLPDAALAKLKIVDLAGKSAVLAYLDKSGRIAATPLYGEIERLAREHNAGLVVFDAVADIFGGDESDRGQVRAFIGLMRGFAMALDAAVLLIAHPSVEGMKTGRGYSGSTHWNNAVRARLTFTKPSGENGKEADADLRVLERSKSNRSRSGEKLFMLWNEGAFVWTTPGMTGNPANEMEDERVFLQLLATTIAEGRDVSHLKNSPTYAPTRFAKSSAGKEIGKVRFEAAMERLFEKKAIRAVAEGPPSHQRKHLKLSEAHQAQ